MKVQFSLFGFVVQVSRVKRFRSVVFVEGPDDPMVWSFQSSSFLLSRFLAWKAARQYAWSYSDSATFIVFEMDYVNKRLYQRLHRTIVINKSVSFFGK